MGQGARHPPPFEVGIFKLVLLLDLLPLPGQSRKFSKYYCSVFFMVGSWRPVRTPWMDLLITASKVRRSAQQKLHDIVPFWGQVVAVRYLGIVFEIVPYYMFSVKK